MKKKNIITSLIIGFAFLPLYVSAESAVTLPVPAQEATATEAQVFTACSQASIEVRDNAIGAARTAYNIAMSAALSARKDAEKKAVALEDSSKKKEAIRATVEAYKKAVTSAQDALTTARKAAWTTFEENTDNCREVSKETRNGIISEKKAAAVEKKAELEEAPQEVKTLRESFFEQLDSLKNFFKKGTPEGK